MQISFNIVAKNFSFGSAQNLVAKVFLNYYS